MSLSALPVSHAERTGPQTPGRPPIGHATGRDGGRARTCEKPLSVAAGERPGVRRSASGQSVHGDPVAAAARLLADHPGMTRADLGRELGVSPRHGLRLKKQAEHHRSDGAALAPS
jgi:hypothetical protein